MNNKNSDNPDGVTKQVVEMSKQSIKISIELFPDGRLELTGPFHQPVMFIGVLEVAKNHVYAQTTGKKQPENIVIPTFKGPM